MTMALSTNIPIAIINEAKETRCKVPCIMWSTTKDPSTTITRLTPMMYPLRNPIKSITITMTITTDSTRLTINTSIALLTRVG